MTDPVSRSDGAASDDGPNGAQDRRWSSSPSPLVRLLILVFIISVIGLTLAISLLVRDDPDREAPTTTTTETTTTTGSDETTSTTSEAFTNGSPLVAV